ncbi:MAG: DUF3078 domain-containing protein [Mariniphaga sp.]|nr:DUF3078 domain-containing protein [Mariniphaga sp.]
MRLKKTIIFLFLSSIYLFSFSQESVNVLPENGDSIQYKIDYLKKYFFENESWQITDSVFSRNIFELINFIEKQPVDSVLNELRIQKSDNEAKLVRSSQMVSDSLSIPGFIPYNEVHARKEEIRKSVAEEFMKNDLQVPVGLLIGIEEKVKQIPQEEGMRLFADSIYYLPDSLLFLDAIPDSMVQTAEDFQRILKLDSIRDVLVEKSRIRYNDSIVGAYRDSILFSYRNDALDNQVEIRLKRYTDSVKNNNNNLIKAYSEYVIREVNDSINYFLNDLIQYANLVDTVNINISNLFDESINIKLADNRQEFGRIWLKNEQNDSISILVSNVDKRGMKMLIDDNVTFSRTSQKQSKEFSISNLSPTANLGNVRERFKVETPWSIGGDGTIGLTQTYLSNWKKGGKSAVSMLLVLKGFANYSTLDNKIKWENSIEIRNGWLKPGGTDENGDHYESQKIDDKFELISRVGVSAFKKWYYSAEIDFQTQFINGYKYPTSINPDPISAFLAPAKTLFKLGLDYKPNSNLSVFLSPITSKTVFIRDTLKINKSNYNIPDGKRSLWVPGLNAEIRYKTDITQNISYETKYKMFMNYTNPFKKFDIDWENLVVMKVNDYINMRLMLHLVYDDDILFPVFDNEGNEISKKPKLQVKELITVGFSYKINKKVYKARAIN